MKAHLYLGILSAFALITASSTPALAYDGLIVHATEIGVGKFHRYDNRIHPYGADNAQTPFILPDAAAPTEATAASPTPPPPVTPITVNNDDGSVTVFFSTLDELIETVTQVSDTRKEPVRVLNIHGHGLPAMMWFPPTAEAMQSADCQPWVAAAKGPDQGNYDQYYTPVTPEELTEIRQFSERQDLTLPCTTGYSDWAEGVAKAPHFTEIFTSDAQIHFQSCVVGLGSAGEEFTRQLATLILGDHASQGRVETAIDLGLSDWSQTGGMGFWNLDKSPAELAAANKVYPADRDDEEVKGLGSIRVASAVSAPVEPAGTPVGASPQKIWTTGLATGLSLMLGRFDTAPVPTPSPIPIALPAQQPAPIGAKSLILGAGQPFIPFMHPAPIKVRVPNTTVRLLVRKKAPRPRQKN